MTDKDLITQIANRAHSINKTLDPETTFLDLQATIEGGTHLKLKEMLEADPIDLIHDIIGINHNLNRTTYKLENHFWPRFAT